MLRIIDAADALLAKQLGSVFRWLKRLTRLSGHRLWNRKMEQVEELKAAGLKLIADASSTAELEQARVELLGKEGKVTELLKGVGKLPPEDRREFGQSTNQLKKLFQEEIEQAKQTLLETESDIEPFDCSLPGIPPGGGGLHPITQMMYDLNDAFLSLGFEVYDGPEITSEKYAFDNLNFRPDHPARESMDTYWLEGADGKGGEERLCLRPHLTGASVRYMQTHKPPFRFVYPGRVYRNEVPDARHERAFFQYEALIVDRKVPFSSGRLLVTTILERVFKTNVKTRMRAGYFPFVEPGFEIDMQCLVCRGEGCSVCKRVGWLEVMPGGATHPNVFRAAGIDPNEWTGFYINIGLDRLVMMRTEMDDVRHFHSGDLRFLKQF